MEPDRVTLHRMWRETVNQLDRHDRRVQEGKGLDAALAFAQFVFWSGLWKLCQKYACDGPLKVDGSFLKWRCEELTHKVQERYRLNDGKPHIESTELEAINRKLDLIAAHVGKFTPPLTATPDAGDSAEPALRVLQGGA